MKPNLTTEVLTGMGAEEVDVSPQYKNSHITIVGITSGIITIRAKYHQNTAYESMITNKLNVEYDRTLIVNGKQIKSFEFTNSLGEPYTVRIEQTGGNTEL